MSEAERLDVAFRKSSFSPDAGTCVEVGVRDAVFFVRDSKHPNGATLVFSRAEWEAFVQGVKAGEFDPVS